MNKDWMRDLTLMVASMITIIGTTAIATALPQMTREFSNLPNGRFLVSICLTLPALTAGLSGPLVGVVIDRWGRKRLFILALILYGVAGTSGFYLTSIYTILIGRLFLGMAVAAITACATSLIADYSSKSRLGAVMGSQSSFMAFGNVLFVFLGGVLATLNWHWPFGIYGIAFLLIPGVFLLISEPRFEVRPQASKGDKSAKFPFTRVLFISLIGFVNMVIYFLIPVNLPFFLQELRGSNSITVGTFLSLVGITWGLSSLFYRKLLILFSFSSILIGTFLLMGVAYLLLGSATSYNSVTIALVIIGAGLGCVLPNLNTWLLSLVSPQAKGRAIGTLVFFVFMGQFFSPILTHSLIANIGIARSYTVAGFLLLAFAFSYSGFLAISRLVQLKSGSLPNLRIK